MLRTTSSQRSLWEAILPAEALGLPEKDFPERLSALEASDLLLPVRASAAMADLQRFHANQLPPDSDFLDLANLCRPATLSGPDGLELSGAELVESAELVAGALREKGAGPGA